MRNRRPGSPASRAAPATTVKPATRVYLPDRLAPYEVLKCELDLSEWGDERLVQGWVDVRRYAGRGVLEDDDLWKSANHSVESPAAAATAIRAVAREMADQLGRIDLRPYLAPTGAEAVH
jgi:hypothetical protein